MVIDRKIVCEGADEVLFGNVKVVVQEDPLGTGPELVIFLDRVEIPWGSGRVSAMERMRVVLGDGTEGYPGQTDRYGS